MKFYLKILAGFFFAGGVLHTLDLFDLRLVFSELNQVWRTWIVFLTVANFVTAYGLWRNIWLGHIGFFTVSGAQLIAYLGFKETFGDQTFLIVFHCLTLTIYLALHLQRRSLSRDG